MKKRHPAHQQIYRLARSSGEDVALLMLRFANERWLYRLSLSEHRDKFYLKGASLFNLWFERGPRPTRDIDLLGRVARSGVEMRGIFAEICRINAADGVIFPDETIRIEEIREDASYGGMRVRFHAELGNSRIPMQVDIGFGDAVTPRAKLVQIPSLLDMPQPKIKAYPKETVIAEKFEAMVKHGVLNSRMKDFWDLRLMIREFEFDAASLRTAIRATFNRRRTPLPDALPTALTLDFSRNKLTQWKAFLRKNRLDDSEDFDAVIHSLAAFFKPLIGTGESDRESHASWKNGQWNF